MKTTLVVTMAVLVGVTAAIAQSPMRPGRWESTMQMQMAGSPIQDAGDEVVAMRHGRGCEGSRALAAVGPGGARRSEVGLQGPDYKVSGNTVTWKMVCTTPQPTTMTGEMTFTDDTYNGTMKMDSPQGPMTMKVAGKRVGEMHEVVTSSAAPASLDTSGGKARQGFRSCC